MFPQSDSVYQEMFNAVRLLVRDAVTPIVFRDSDGEIKPHGTGTLLAVANSHFVVSAGHVFEQATAAQVPLYGFAFGADRDGGSSMIPVHLDGRSYRFEDPADVAVLHLKDGVAEHLSGRRFLRLDEVSLRPSTPGWGWMSGFPCEWVRDTSVSSVAYNPFNLGSPISTESPQDVDNYHPEIHFLLNADQQRLWRIDGGTVELPTSLGGVSGCSVWQTWWPGEDEGEQWHSRRVRVVGVQTGVYPRRQLIKASTWAAALLLIYRAQPDLKCVIQLHFPGLELRD